ncbi:MAG: PQQ-binding-like beta-propeller repeat protein [Verrucomicrobiales bacterium]|nr:PQQ-binding-like beta-propeller repeat protein [Verrucomicrobiales bacterium]
MTKFALCVTAVLCGGAGFLPGQEWTRFRGPKGSGINDKGAVIPDNFTAKDFRWTLDLPGAGTSSPVLWGTRLFLTAESGKDGARQVLCVDSESGRVLWTVEDAFKPHRHHRFNNFASSSPAVDAEHLYVAWTSGDQMQVLALTHDGKLAWQTSLGYFFEEHGSGTSPVVVGETLVVSKDHKGRDAFIAGLSTADGKILWKVPRQTAHSSFSTPLVFERVPGRPEVVFNSNPQALTSIDPASGKVLWEQSFADKTEFRAVGSPVAAEGVVFAMVGQGSGGKASVALRLKEDAPPETAWELNKALAYVPTPLAVAKHFYILNDGGILSCVRAASGEVVYSERVLENAYSSPVSTAGKIYCISRTGEVAVVKAGEKFEVLGRASLGEPCESTPALANGMMFIRTAKRLLALWAGPTPPKNFHRGLGLRMELVSEVASIQPGRPFTVGLKIQHDPGYHTYWVNPGIAGLKINLDWSLPPGWKAGPQQWPPPEKVWMASLRSHGYERDVSILVDLTPPAGALPETVDLRAKVTWMCCTKVCYPGVCDMELTLPVSPAPPQWAPGAHANFEAMRATFPKPASGWKFKAVCEGDKVRLSGRPETDATLRPAGAVEAQFFSSDNLICSNPEQLWQWDGAAFSVILTMSEPEFRPASPATLNGLLYAPGGWNGSGGNDYVSIAVPLENSPGVGAPK